MGGVGGVTGRGRGPGPHHFQEQIVLMWVRQLTLRITVANWPIFRPLNSKPVQQKCQRTRKFSGLESGFILKMRPNLIVM
jgi:hypothetical protein